MDLNYVKLALGVISDKQKNEEIISLVNETLKQAAIDVDEETKQNDEGITIMQSSNPMVSFVKLVEEFPFTSKEKGKVFAKEYLSNLIRYAEENDIDQSVVNDLNTFLNMI